MRTVISVVFAGIGITALLAVIAAAVLWLRITANGANPFL